MLSNLFGARYCNGKKCCFRGEVNRGSSVDELHAKLFEPTARAKEKDEAHHNNNDGKKKKTHDARK